MTVISPIFATAFRLASFLFLRVIPSPVLHSAIPALFSLYLLSSRLSSAKPARNTNPIAAIVFSLKTPSRIIRWTNIGINILLLAAFLDLSASPYFDDGSDVVFSRIGAVSSNSAKIVLRYPDLNLNETIQLVWREIYSSSWNKGLIFTLDAESDWTDTVTLSGLFPSTDYEYALAWANSSLLPYPDSPRSFRTFPDPQLPGGNHFRFITSSCILPNFPYAPGQRRVIKGFDLLADYLFPAIPSTNNDIQDADSTHAEVTNTLPASFLLFLGDFIYADVPFYFGNSKESYRRLYRRNYQSPSFRKIYERLPIFHTYDDHEIINNFSGAGNDSTQPYPNAADAFQIYNANGNPPPPLSTKGLDHVPYYYDFRYGDVAFFVLDTRRYRSFPTDPSEEKTMLGEDQLAGLLDWLGKANNTATFKFIVSSVPFTDLWGHDARYDSWAGFSKEKFTLLSAIHSVPNVFVLSGDRHEFAVIEFAAPSDVTFSVTEFSTSPLSMFYIPYYHTLSTRSHDTVVRSHIPEKVSAVEAPAATEEHAASPIEPGEIALEQNNSSVSAEYIGDHNSTLVETIVIEEVPKELVVKYIPAGNHKWSSIEIDTRDPQCPTLKLEVVIDGKPAYEYEVSGVPVKLQKSTALGAFVSSNMKDILHKLGMNPRKWF